jgi:GxxExxY protein
VYQICVADVLARKGLTFRQKPELDIEFEGRRIPGGLEPDFVVEDSVILELKATEEIHPVFKAQVLTYLRLSGLRLGYLVNFNVPRFGQGIKRFIYTGSRPQQDLDP